MKRPEPMRGVPEMLSVRTVCRTLNISRRTLYRRPYRYSQARPGAMRQYFADDIRLSLLLNTVTPEGR